MADFTDEAGAVSDQMRMMRMMASAGGGGAASSAPPSASAPAAAPKPAGKPRSVEQQLYIQNVPFRVRVSLPPGYDRAENSSDRYYTLYILDRDERIFDRAADATTAAYAAVSHLEGRNWYPDFIIVTAYIVPPPNTGATWLAANKPSPTTIVNLMAAHLLPYVERTFRVEPFAAGRAICGLADDGCAAAQAALRDAEKLKLFHHVIVGSPAEASDADALRDGPPLEPKSAICLCVGRSEANARGAAARSCQAALSVRADASSTDTVMTVDRTGEQHYSSAEGLGVAIDLREADGAAGSDAIVKAAVEWLGERLERRKLERLGSLMPWHEFK